MNETKSTGPKSKKEKVGPDGLSKKERRAQKVAEKVIVEDKKIEKPVIKEIPQENSTGQTLSKKERRALKVSEKQEHDKPQGVETQLVVKDKVNKKRNEKDPLKVSSEQNVNNDARKESKDIEGKSKAQLKAERRELQEKQRLAKQSTKENKVDAKEETKLPEKSKPLKKSPKKFLGKHESSSQVQLFNHLHFTSQKIRQQLVVENVHPSFIKLGSQYASQTILGSNARCLALLMALKDLIDDFITPPKQELCRSLEIYLQSSVTYLQQCRPFAVSMTNALRHFKVHLTQIRTDFPDEKKKCLLQKNIETYIDEEINTAGRAISLKLAEKITDGDVILTYGCSSLIKKILIDARAEGKKFRVIVVDGRPLLEGRVMLRKLVNAGIDCSYTLINAISFIMGQATKVLLGAHALLANGYVMARTGTAQTALIAKAYNKPVLVCCETYKFCERVQTDSFVYNELGESEKLLNVDTLEERSPLKTQPRSNTLTLLNLMYDVTPPDLVTAVVTEVAILPCTSVPVILRIKPTE